MLTIVGQPAVVRSMCAIADSMLWRFGMSVSVNGGNGGASCVVVVVDAGVGWW